MGNLTETLLALRARIDKDKASRQEKQGELKQLKAVLKSEYGCSSIEEARKKLKGMKSKLEVLESDLSKGLERLEREYAKRTTSDDQE